MYYLKILIAFISLTLVFKIQLHHLGKEFLKDFDDSLT